MMTDICILCGKQPAAFNLDWLHCELCYNVVCEEVEQALHGLSHCACWTCSAASVRLNPRDDRRHHLVFDAVRCSVPSDSRSTHRIDTDDAQRRLTAAATLQA